VVSDYDLSQALFNRSVNGKIYRLHLASRQVEAIAGTRASYAFSSWTAPLFGRSILPAGHGTFAAVQQAERGVASTSSEMASLPWRVVGIDADAKPLTWVWDSADPEPSNLAELLESAVLQPSAAPETMLVKTKAGALVVSVNFAGEARIRRLDVGVLPARRDDRREWRQMFDELAYACEQYFAEPKLNGVNWKQVVATYRSWLSEVRTRADLSYLFENFVGELSNSHFEFIPVKAETGAVEEVGLLGADFDTSGGAYMIADIPAGPVWDGERSPLADAGARPGDMIVAVEEEAVSPRDDLYRALVGRAGKETRITLRSNGGPAHTVSLRPLASEAQLRLRAWIEGNRHQVEQRSHGRIAYIYQPDTTEIGLAEFRRSFFPQADRDALIIDERFNQGGADPDYQLDVMGRRPFISYELRSLRSFDGPGSMIQGPKVMLVNAESGSGGDVYPMQFKARGLGYTIGTRSWGGVNGYYRLVFNEDSVPNRLADGTRFVVPDLVTFAAGDRAIVENIGFTPDELVEIRPGDAAHGSDPQLNRAIEYLLSILPNPR
jgi:tricorn protease